MNLDNLEKIIKERVYLSTIHPRVYREHIDRYVDQIWDIVRAAEKYIFIEECKCSYRVHCTACYEARCKIDDAVTALQKALVLAPSNGPDTGRG